MPSYLDNHQILIVVIAAWAVLRVPSTCWLRIHMTPHANWRLVCGGTWPYGKDVAHLVDLDVTSQRLTFTDQPVSSCFVGMGQCQAAHAR